MQARIAAAASTHVHDRGFDPTFISGCFFNRAHGRPVPWAGRPVALTIVAVPLEEDMLRSGVYVALAIRLFQNGTPSLGKAAKLAGRRYHAMVEQLASISVPAIDYPPEELNVEVAAIG